MHTHFPTLAPAAEAVGRGVTAVGGGVFNVLIVPLFRIVLKIACVIAVLAATIVFLNYALPALSWFLNHAIGS
ncbi:MAG: hypothetical protein PF961_16595 [Planctomycetota bacterium]|nr:hypothetical protein [Planctomycetota bacterium]